MSAAGEQERILSGLRTAHRVAGVGSWVWALDDAGRTRSVEWSPEVHHIAGWPHDQPPSYGDFLAAIHRDDRPGFFEVRDAALAGTRPYRIDLRLVRPDADVRHVHVAAEVHRRDDGTPERLMGVIQDRTDEIESMRRVRSAEASRRHLLQRLLDAADHERERLGRHLDTGAVAQLQAVESSMAAAIGPDAPQAWHDALDSIRRSISALSAVVSAIATSQPGGDLATVVSDLAADAAADLEVRADIDLRDPLRPALRSVVVRLVQEGLQNTRKHAHAQRADIEVRARADTVRVRVADDGRGFDPEALRPQRGHFGIASLRDDVAAVGGELDIRSGPEGTVLEARLPIH